MIPDFQTLMLPLLKAVADGKEHKLNDIIDILAKQFNLTEQERSELLPSGQALVFNNRIGWAKTYLKKSGLVDSPGRAIVQITNKGKQVLKESPTEINIKFLRRFAEFLEFHNLKKQDNIKVSVPLDILTLDQFYKETPEEQTFSGIHSAISLK